MEFITYKIGDVAKITAGGDAPKNVSDVPTETCNVPIYSNGIDNEGLYGYTDKAKIEGDSVTVTARGVNIGTAFYRKEPFLPIVRLLSIVPNRTLIYPKYLYYYLKGIEIIGTGSAQPQIPVPFFSRKKIKICKDICVQQKIAESISMYDELIENNNKRINLLEQMAENLYKEWFVRFRFPGHEGVEFENGLPMGWVYTTIEDLSEILQRGISPQYDDDGEYTVISQKCIRTSVVDFSESRHQTKKYKSELNLQDADIVICSTGTGTLGRVGKVIGNYPNTTFDSHVTLVRAKAGISKQYLYSAIKNMQVWLENMGVGSTNQQELNRKTIKNAKIVLPDENTMKRFEEISKCIHDEIGSLIASRDNLTKQRDLLLPRLMSGKLEVK